MRSINTHILLGKLCVFIRRKSDFSFAIFNITNMCLINTIGIIFFHSTKIYPQKSTKYILFLQ